MEKMVKEKKSLIREEKVYNNRNKKILVVVK
jgi:hypothetical protein